MSLTAEPAPVPGVAAARTMYAALYGELVPHPRARPPDADISDLYTLFETRSTAMGWLTPATEDASGGLWGMNDAQAAPGPGPRLAVAAWIQVVLTGPTDSLLPVQQFLTCARDAVARLGTLRLRALQVLLPSHDPDRQARSDSPSGIKTAAALLDAVSWFACCDPQHRIPVRVTLNGGADPSIQTAAPDITRAVLEVGQNIFSCDSFSLASSDHLILGDDLPLWAPFGQTVNQHRVTFHGELVEWSLDALGWLAAFLADLGSRQGVRTQMMLAAELSSPGD